MLDSSDLVAFVAATDLRRAQDFYEHTLGLRVLDHHDLACVLDANGTMLRVTAVPKVAHARIGMGEAIRLDRPVNRVVQASQ